MDYIILNSDGSLNKQSLTRYIMQGNHGVDKIFVGWANGLATDIAQAVFTLPNQTTNTELGTFQANYNYDGEHTINGWVFTLTNAQTLYNGLLLTSIRVIRNGVVQVAYPFSLVINETGVRPDTDSGVTIAQLDSYLLNIQNVVTGVVQINTDAALSNTSENPVQNKVITAALEAIKRGSYTKVDTTEYPTLADFLDSTGEEGFLYLYPVNTSDEDDGYYQYIWENDQWIPLGTTKIDIANMVTTDTPQTISGAKIFTTDTNIGDNTQSESPKLGFISTDATNQGNWYLFVNQNQNNFNICQLNSGQYIGVKFTRSSIWPTHNGYTALGSDSYRFKQLFLKQADANNKYGIDFGNNAKIYEDTSNRIVIQYNGNDKIKVGNTETYFCNHVEPDSNNTYDLGRTNVAWRDIFLSGSIKNASGTKSIGVESIGKKLYKHTITSGGSDFLSESLIIISTNGTGAEDVQDVDSLMSSGYVNAYLVTLVGQYAVVSYELTTSTSCTLKNLAILGNNISVVTSVLNDSDVVTDVVEEL